MRQQPQPPVLAARPARSPIEPECREPGLPSDPQHPRSNRLLAALSEAELGHWLPALEAVVMPVDMVLWDSGQPIRHVYFPTTGVVGLMYQLLNGATAEVSMVGNEGLAGVAMFLGGGSSLCRALVLNAGHGFRLPASALMAEFGKGGAAMRLLLRYTQSFTTQVAQTAVCNRHHTLEQRLCRLLLSSMDRVGRKDFQVTHETLASLLGVRREGVTDAARGLRTAGCIECKRGEVSVKNRPALMARSCECYGVIKTECDRLFPPAHFQP